MNGRIDIPHTTGRFFLPSVKSTFHSPSPFSAGSSTGLMSDGGGMVVDVVVVTMDGSSVVVGPGTVVDVVVVDSVVVVAGIVVSGTVVSVGSTSARDAAGAAAGAVSCSHISRRSTTAPMPLLRAHVATFCCSP